jgi:hypothetical protein
LQLVAAGRSSPVPFCPNPRFIANLMMNAALRCPNPGELNGKGFRLDLKRK